MIPPIADRFVAGESAESALEHARSANKQGISCILNQLGEHYGDSTNAEADTHAYLDLLEALDNSDVSACVSIKPSQIGLDIAETEFRENLARIVQRAHNCDNFVWVDMEDHQTTDATLHAFESLSTKYDGTVGVCIQSNLKRTRNDLKHLADLPGKVRLVKGAYDEPSAVALQEKSAVDEAYRAHLEFMFEEFDNGIAVGSHDPAMISHAKSLYEEYRTPFEIQMLMGVREDTQRELATEYEVWQYVPYGSKWPSYFYRRVRERKENLLFALRAIMTK
ncbi:proline dehydrogenase family protein [Haladaptatus sp. SPP-AMP-3]|uniref:proline dehydrogenase family protein n=1 Tax=Haladaptatus sp. SPP-AMP-3 TaxID=3121295 RepID=UPI003C2B9E25